MGLDSSERDRHVSSRHPSQGASAVADPEDQPPAQGPGTAPQRILAPDGTAVGDPAVGLDPAELRELLRWMLVARRLDRECIALQRQGQLTVYPGFEGQEAAQIGSATALAASDF